MASAPSILVRLRHSSIGWFAALCLVAGWIHVGLHQAAHGHDGHFGTVYGEQCLLANIPPLTLPDPPDCEAPALRPSHPLIALVARHDDHSPLLLRIRAPPIA